VVVRVGGEDLRQLAAVDRDDLKWAEEGADGVAEGLAGRVDRIRDAQRRGDRSCLRAREAGAAGDRLPGEQPRWRPRHGGGSQGRALIRIVKAAAARRIA